MRSDGSASGSLLHSWQRRLHRNLTCEDCAFGDFFGRTRDNVFVWIVSYAEGFSRKRFLADFQSDSLLASLKKCISYRFSCTCVFFHFSRWLRRWPQRGSKRHRATSWLCVSTNADGVLPRNLVRVQRAIWRYHKMRFVWIFVCARHVSFLFTLNRLRRCLCFRDEAFWLGYSIAVVFRCIQAIAGHVSNFPATILLYRDREAISYLVCDLPHDT